MDWHELDSVCEVIIIYWVQLLGVSPTYTTSLQNIQLNLKLGLLYFGDTPTQQVPYFNWMGGESESSDKHFLLTSLNKTIQKPIVLDEENITYCWEKGSKN